MSETLDTIVHGGRVCCPSTIGSGVSCDIGVLDGRIVALGDLSRRVARERIDASGLDVLPGVVDSQVHFREPGLEHKEDLASGTRGAVLGGVTTVFEMPNTKPNTDTPERLADKVARAKGRAWCDHAFYIGATGENADRLGEYENLPGSAGIKVFMGSSTGTLLVSDDATLARVLRSGRRRVAIHAEDEPRLIERKRLAASPDPRLHPVWRDEQTALLATERALRAARATGRRVHILHVTTAEEMELLARHKDVATVEVLPQHLTLAAPECYERLGTYAQMNPPIRDARHQAALWRAVREGVVDVLGSDHAPHTREEKSKPYPDSPSGLTGVQTLLPLMLDHVAHGRLSLERLVELTSAGPQRVFGMASKGRVALGYDADLTIVDLRARRVIEDRWIASKAGWTPFAGMQVVGWPIMTIVRGRLVMRDDEVLGAPVGEPVRFVEALA